MSLVPAPTSNLSWSQLISHARSFRAEIRPSLTLPFSHMQLVETEDGCRLYALGTPQGQHSQTLLYADIGSNHADAPIILQPLLVSDGLRTCAPSQEFSLMCERQRSSVVTGIADYTVHAPSHSFVITTGDQALRVSDVSNKPIPLASPVVLDGSSSNFVSDAQICPSDPLLVSFVMNKQIHLEYNGQLIFSTKSDRADVTNGIPSFITQEELDRYDGVWWSSKSTRLVYERVNEAMVKSLSFACPGKPFSSPMKYPIAGTLNATSEIRLLLIENNIVHDIGLRQPLQKKFPWIEYIARIGFLNDGKTVFVHALNRPQTKGALIVIPESDFEGLDNVECQLKSSAAIHEENTPVWINTHNSIVPLDSPTGSTIEFLVSSEEQSQCHLYRVVARLNKEREVESIISLPITSGPFSICKATKPVTDNKRKLVYFVANISSSIEWNVCVASYSSPLPQVQQLTRSGESYRVERSYHTLSLLPDVGFACFITSLQQPNQCRFYRIVHSADGLPNVKLDRMISLPGLAIPTPLSHPGPEIIKYTSRNSGFTHFAMFVRPCDYQPGMKYPVIQYVYGGPGIQVVKNDHSAWISFQKFTRLGFAVVLVDGRGTSNRGRDFEKPIKANMGSFEAEDQLEGLMEIHKATNGMIDLERVAIQGWSYGGFMSLLVLARYPEIYRAGVAGGAVADWSLYDTAYTERYLGYPLSNVYEKSSVGAVVDRLPDEPGRLMIIHGLIDENVHFRHTEVLIEALIRNSKPYQLQIYPSERHGVRSSNGACHLDATMITFIQKALGPK